MTRKERTRLAQDVAQMLWETADPAEGERLAKMLSATGANQATVCCTAIYILSDILAQPNAPPETPAVWYDAVMLLLKAGLAAMLKQQQAAVH